MMFGLIRKFIAWTQNWDLNDPIDRAYRRYFILACRWAAMLCIVLIALVIVGVPHIQTTYRYSGPRNSGEHVAAERKHDAWYISVTGWEHVRSREYGQEGCPYILFVPLGDCLFGDD